MRWNLVCSSLSVAALATAPASATDLEVSAQGGALSRTQENDALSSPGPVLGLSPMLRLGELIAVGLLFEYARLSWSEAALRGPGASADRLLVAGALRWYPLGSHAVEPYLQVAGGYVAHSPLPDAGGCTTDMPGAAQLTGGMDGRIASWAKLGGSLSLTRAAVWSSSCVEIARVAVEPGLGISSQLTFTTIWEQVL